MHKELELWQFIASRLKKNEQIMLLVVAESSGSSPGRAGYKMAVDANGELCGSIGGGVMEVDLVEQSRRILSEPPAPLLPEEGWPRFADGVVGAAGGLTSFLKPQVHQKQAQNPSGMICSGKQTVIFRMLTLEDVEAVGNVIEALENMERAFLTITSTEFRVEPPESETLNEDFHFEKLTDTNFVYKEKLGRKNRLYIVGGGHCALALSELMSPMDFHIRLFDDRPKLNTLEKNQFADEIDIISNYEQIREFIPSGANVYVVVMTLGYTSDKLVIRSLISKDFKYFGVLGSEAKMATLLKELKNEGVPAEKLDTIHTPIGLPINSRTPEEIAVSIAAEIISIKNK